jgi:hypothetical protein
MNYNLDPKAASAADVIFSKIEQKGKYLGVLTRAEPVTSKKGTTGVDLSFRANSGETADYLTLWTNNTDGKQLMGFNTLMAIMTCLRVKTINAVDGEIEKYDQDQAKRVKVTVPLFKELMNKPIGLLLAMEEYPKNAGGTGWKPVISAAFDENEFTASEILSQARTQELLGKMVMALHDKPLKGSSPAPAQNHGAPSTGSDFDDFKDDIPFN